MQVTTLSLDVPNLVHEYKVCRSCGDSHLIKELDLGNHVVSDFYTEPPALELRAPLTLMRCAKCNLVQLSHSVAKNRLYRNYWYRSGINETMVAALKDIVSDAMAHTHLDYGDSVLDIGSNDSTLLDQYPNHLYTFGIEPSNVAIAKSHKIYRGYYPITRPMWTEGTKPKIITSIACFYDIDDPNGFVKAIKEDLHKDGVWICQMMDLDGMLEANAFDNICHEHVAYWSVDTFIALVEAHGLRVTRIRRNNVNGGSVRFHVKHGVAKQEWYNGMGAETQEIRAFAHSVEEAKDQALAFLEECRQDGKTVMGYGASTKGNTLLQYYGITPDLILAIADRNPDKWNKVTAGTHIPIVNEDVMRDYKPDYLFIFPWAFLDNFLRREVVLRRDGTKFIVPLPEFRVI